MIISAATQAIAGAWPGFGHIALAALGMLNVLFGLSPLPPAGGAIAKLASAGFIAGAILMPLQRRNNPATPSAVL